MIQINNLNHPELDVFTNKKDRELLKNNLLIVESSKVVKKLLKTNIKIQKILCSEEFYKEHNTSLKEIQCYVGSPFLFKSITGHNKHQGVFALCEKPFDIKLQNLDNKIIILNGLTQAENIGSIIRSTCAFNINSLIADEKTASPFLRRSIRVSMGNIFNQKIHHSKDIVSTIFELKNLGYKIIGSAGEGTIDFDSFKFPEKAALIIGSEGHGLSEEVRTICDKIVRININSSVAHLNASVACAVLCSRWI